MSYAITQFRVFADEHDSLPAFHAAYLVMTIMAAIMFNLGVFGMLILCHMTLDVVKYRDVHHLSWRKTLKAMTHENLIDITLLSVALVFSVYFHHFVGLVGISGLLRAELTIMRVIGTVAPKFLILENFLKILSHVHHYIEEMHPNINRGWSFLDRLFLGCIATSILLVVFTPILTGADPDVVKSVVLWELVPWNL